MRRTNVRYLFFIRSWGFFLVHTVQTVLLLFGLVSGRGAAKLAVVVLFFNPLYLSGNVFATTVLGMFITNYLPTNFFIPIYDLFKKLNKSDFQKNCNSTFLASQRQKGSADAGNVVPTWLLKWTEVPWIMDNRPWSIDIQWTDHGSWTGPGYGIRTNLCRPLLPGDQDQDLSNRSVSL